MGTARDLAVSLLGDSAVAAIQASGMLGVTLLVLGFLGTAVGTILATSEAGDGFVAARLRCAASRAPPSYSLAALVLALAAQASSTADVGQALQQLAKGEQISGLPPADSVSPGARTIPRRLDRQRHHRGPRPVDVVGTVEGSVVSLGSDVTVRRGGHVTGDAVSVGGRVLADSGIVMARFA